MQPSSTLQPVGTQQHVETPEAEEQSLPSIDLPPDADFYGDYLQKLKEITWRFEISLETYLMERGINRERKPISSWKTRIKSPDSMREKLIKRGYEPTAENAVYAVHDAAGVRVICPLVDDVASVAQFIRELPCFEVVQEKDYILHPKQEISLSQLIDQLNTSGTFDTIESKGAEAQTGDNRFEFGRRMCVEVQLRTIAMDSWASIEHDLKYKKDVPNQEFLQAELKRCADEMAATDLSLQTIADLINVK